ncbi:hypothetical protein THARTR1_08001 [Trichoderma harzianum]|uniref:Uncharacterized protein n=1 Tax=Trichoderma harzianum TaxID=5544 RepID=A0A2K0U0Q6_TRIHA|nr:hypothetical protein THARTR1_08001 [Trichoderma harzianum]
MATEPDSLAAGPKPEDPSIAASKPSHRHQQFIPQFLLTNFAHKYAAPDSLDTEKGKKSNAKAGMYSGEPAVNTVHVSGRVSLEECPVRRPCGMEDTYEDTENLLKDHDNIAKKFAATESTASFIYRKIIKTYKNGKDNICLTRKENDFLRKFIFLLTLHSEKHHQKYNINSIQDYIGDDRSWLQEYMEAYGIAKPIDVWLQSLEVLIDLEIDPDGAWVEFIKEAIYFPIADTFIDHMKKMYMAICTPDDRVEEFILTDNCCNATEGMLPAYLTEHMISHLGLAPCFHRFAPISPKLMIVLRYNHLPEQLGLDPVATVQRQTQQKTRVEAGSGNGTRSMLEDLPIRKAKITPMEEVNGELVPRVGGNRKLYECDNFYFTIFKLSTEHVRIINGLLINLAFYGSRIIFFRRKAFMGLMTWYLAEPCTVGKTLAEKRGAQQLGYIRDLFQFMRREGREISLEWTFGPNEDGDPDQAHIQNVAITNYLEDTNRGYDGSGLDHDTLYQKLGGTNETVKSDTAAALIMFDTWIMSVDLNYGSPDYETTCRKKLERLLAGYQGQTSTRFWGFLKKMRLARVVATKVRHSVPGVALLFEPESQGPEDMLAYAHSTVTDKELNVAMYKAFNKSIVEVRGAGNGLETMGQFDLFRNSKWRNSKPSGRGEPRGVDKKKKEKKSKEMVGPALPENTNGEASIESACKEKQVDAREKSDDDKKATCSLQPESTNKVASTDYACKGKQPDAKEKRVDDKKALGSQLENTSEKVSTESACEKKQVDAKEKGDDDKKAIGPLQPESTNGKASMKSACEEKQPDAKENSDDDKKLICSLQLENTNEKASTESVCENKQLDAQEEIDDEKKAIRSSQIEGGEKEHPALIDEPTKTCDDDKTKDEVCASDTVYTEDKPTSSSPDESTKREEQTDTEPTEQQLEPIDDVQKIEDGPAKAMARNQKGSHTLPDNKKMWHVCATAVSCLLGSVGLFVLGVLGCLVSLLLRALSYAVSQLLRHFVGLLDNMAVASNDLRFALFPMAKYLLYVTIIIVVVVLSVTKVRKFFRK